MPPSAALDADGVADSLAGSSAGEAAERFAEALVLVSNAAVCPPSTRVRRAPDAAGWIRYRWRVECPTGTGALEIRSRVLLDVAPSHLHFARVRFEATPERIREQVLTEAAPRFVLRGDPASDPTSDPRSGNAAASEIGSRFVDYLALGVRHILSGWDHLAFLFGLILLSDRLGTIARLVTGFTLAHSLTLALGVLDLVHPHAAAVEAVIAFSVALVAIEKGWLVAGRPRLIPACLLAGLALLALASAVSAASLPTVSVLGLILFTACYFAIADRTQSDRFRIALTFAFGLVHGFGFAGILQELELPTDRLVPALAGFNLGVEIGQIGIVLLAWPALALAGRVTAPRWQHGVRDLATAGLCGLGCFWLLERAFSFVTLKSAATLADSTPSRSSPSERREHSACKSAASPPAHPAVRWIRPRAIPKVPRGSAASGAAPIGGTDRPPPGRISSPPCGGRVDGGHPTRRATSTAIRSGTSRFSSRSSRSTSPTRT